MDVEIAGRYRIEKQLSRHGATALIFLAGDQTRKGDYVVLKCARSGKNRHLFQDHLRQEAELLQRLSHPGIVRLYPALDNHYLARAKPLPDAPWYYVMEYVPGGSLRAIMSIITTHYPLERRLHLFRTIVDIVAYLHEQGYGHGDVKPEHILFRLPLAPGDPVQPVLIDFGCASQFDATRDDQSLSVPYAAPELLQALEAKIPLPLIPAQDIWALGALLFEIITGKRLVSGRNWRSLRNNDADVYFSLRGVLVPSSIECLLLNMLQSLPEDRPSITDIQQELQGY